MAVDCTDIISVRTAVCNNATDIQEMIELSDDGTLTTNYGAKPIALLVKEKLITDLQALGITYVWAYIWADITARNAQTGMATGEQGYQTDTGIVYQYDGAIWQVVAVATGEQSYNTVTNEIFKYSGTVWNLFYSLASQSDITANTTAIAINTNNRISVVVTPPTDADYTLTATENQYGRIEVDTTNWTTARNIIMDNNEHTFLAVVNNTGSQNATFKTSAGTGILVLNDSASELRNDTVNVIEFEATTSSDTRLNTASEDYAGQAAGEEILKTAGGWIKNQCTSWANINAVVSPTIRDGYNIASVVRSGLGSYDITFAVPMDNANYAVTSSSYNFGGGRSRDVGVEQGSMTVNGFRLVIITDSTITRDDIDYLLFAVFGGRN